MWFFQFENVHVNHLRGQVGQRLRRKHRRAPSTRPPSIQPPQTRREMRTGPLLTPLNPLQSFVTYCGGPPPWGGYSGRWWNRGASDVMHLRDRGTQWIGEGQAICDMYPRSRHGGFFSASLWYTTENRESSWRQSLSSLATPEVVITNTPCATSNDIVVRTFLGFQWTSYCITGNGPERGPVNGSLLKTLNPL